MIVLFCYSKREREERREKGVGSGAARRVLDVKAETNDKRKMETEYA